MRPISRRSSYVWALTAAGIVAWSFYGKFRADQANANFMQNNRIMANCARLQLMMTREEVIQMMGPPIKEYDVKPAKEPGVVYRELAFPMPLTGRPAIVDFDIGAQKAVRIACTADPRTMLSLHQSAKERLRQRQPVSTAPGLPTFR